MREVCDRKSIDPKVGLKLRPKWTMDFENGVKSYWDLPSSDLYKKSSRKSEASLKTPWVCFEKSVVLDYLPNSCCEVLRACPI